MEINIKSNDFRNQRPVHLCFTSIANLGKTCQFSEFQFPYVHNGQSNTLARESFIHEPEVMGSAQPIA